jgi:two-component system chemotaxis response regulator CheY
VSVYCLCTLLGRDAMALVMKDKNFPVLVVDDFSTMRRIIKSALKQMGLEDVTEAEDGNIAFQKLKLKEFRLIVSDWNMPNCMGIDLLRKVRADEKYKHIPFLMVTAEARKDNVLEAAKAGVSNYITKPFTAEELQKKIEMIIVKEQQKQAGGAAPAAAKPGA